MATRILIRGGTILDGLGHPAYSADVRMSGGRIIEVGRNLIAQVGERVFDATGFPITSDFVEAVHAGAVRRARVVAPTPTGR